MRIWQSRLTLKLSVMFIIALLSLWVNVSAQVVEQQTTVIVSGLLDALVITNPVVLDIRCGEWTTSLDREIRLNLLKRGIEIREINIGLLSDESGSLSKAADEIDSGIKLLETLKLQRADLLELSMEQTIETGEKRSIFSYARYNAPVYRFELKQVTLPEQRLVELKEYKLTGKPEIENPGSLLAMKWYEPIIASAILGSLVLMLWTLK